MAMEKPDWKAVGWELHRRRLSLGMTLEEVVTKFPNSWGTSKPQRLNFVKTMEYAGQGFTLDRLARYCSLLGIPTFEVMLNLDRDPRFENGRVCKTCGDRYGRLKLVENATWGAGKCDLCGVGMTTVPTQAYQGISYKYRWETALLDRQTIHSLILRTEKQRLSIKTAHLAEMKRIGNKKYKARRRERETTAAN